MSAKKLLMLVGDCLEDYEVMVPFRALLMVGHTVHAVCPKKRAGEAVRTAIHDFEGDQTYSEKRGHNFTLNATFDEIRPRTMTVWCSREAETAGALKGKSCSCYPAVSPDVASCGGTYVELAMEKAHTDGNLVTAPAWPAHPAWLAQSLKVLGTTIEPWSRVSLNLFWTAIPFA